MTPEQWRHISAVFHQALHRERAGRIAFLDDVCRDDVAIRLEVDRLLAAHDAAGGFGQTPAPLVDEAAADSVAEAPPPRDPFLLVVWVCAAITAAAFAYGATRLVTAPGGPATVGWTERFQAGAWQVASVAAGSAAVDQLRTGDRIVALDGVPPLAALGTVLHRLRLIPGDSYRIEIDRAGERRSLQLRAVPPQPRRLERAVYFISSLIWCVVGLWIGAARPEHPLGRLATAAALAVGLVFLTIGVLDGAPFWAPLHVVLAYHFLARFPTGEATSGAWRALLAILYVLVGASLLCRVAFDTILFTLGLSGAAPFDQLLAIRALLAVMVFTGSVAGMVGVTIRNYRRLTTDDQRRRVEWVGYAAVVGLAPEVWYAGVALYQTFVGPTRLPRLDLVANILPVVIPLSIAYVIVKHRVLDIKVVVRRTVQHLLARRVLQAAVAIPIVALIYIAASNRHLTVAALVGDTRAYLYWLGAAAIALRYRRRIELWLDRRFFREQYDREQLLLGLLDDVRRVESIADLSRLVSDSLVSALHPTTACIWYRDPAELAAVSSSNPLLAPRDVPASEPWLAWLEERAATELPAPAAAGLTRAESRWFAARGITLIVPILDNHDRLVGALLMGEKKSDEPYSPGDKQLLAAVARQAAVVRENLRLRARVNDEARIRHDVLAKLDDRLPDLLKECPACGRCFGGAADRCDADNEPLTLSLPVARTIDGKYRLDRLLGRGGMGAVYEARDLRLGRLVAVKIMRGRTFGQPAALRRFNREARAAARLTHPNIVRVYDIGSLEGEGAYFVMERVHGVTMRTELDRIGGPMPPALAADWFGQVLDGLAHAHAAGLVHRDLKPENVMGARTDGQFEVKLLDLGLVKVRADEGGPTPTMTAEGLVMGTLGYMAPEQLLGREVDERADIYAIGIMLVEALTGRRPPGDGRASPADAYRLSGSSAAIALDALVQGCLVVDPRRRLSSAAALGAELVPLLRACDPAGLAL